MNRRNIVRFAFLLAGTGFAVAAAHADSNPPAPQAAAHASGYPFRACPPGSSPVSLLDEVRHGTVTFHAFPTQAGSDEWGRGLSSGGTASFCLAVSGGAWTVDAQTPGGRIMTATTVHPGQAALRRLLGRQGDTEWYFADSGARTPG